MTRNLLTAVLILAMVPCLLAEDKPVGTRGWRGNWTGLYPDAQVPAEWSNVSTGPMQTMKCTTTQPADGSDKDAVPVEQGLVPQWLVIGPFPVEDGTKDFAKQVIPDEAKLAPKCGDKVGELEWRFAQPTSDGVSFWNVNTIAGRGNSNQAAYAHTALYAKTAGKVRAVLEHVVGTKVFVNGKEVYSDPEQRIAMGSAYALSRCRVDSTHPVAPSFEFDVNQGWNRLTVKVVSPSRGGWNDLSFFLRLADVAGAKYDRKNIVWMTLLPDRSNAAPIVVGDKLFVVAEPDELLCIDKNTGKVLWNALHNYFEAATPEELSANPALKEKVEPLAKQAKEETDTIKRAQARNKLQAALAEIDKPKYAEMVEPLAKLAKEATDDAKKEDATKKLQAAQEQFDKVRFTADMDGHLAAHFEIVGFTTNACSDGKFVYVWCGNGVAACYDLDGKRQWITRFRGKLFYSAAPALIDGVFGVYLGKLRGLDAKTGKVLWEQPEVNKTVASLIAARIAGTGVIVSQQGEVVRASDGKMLWKNPHKITNDTGWAAPVVNGDTLYIPWYGIAMVWVEDFTGCTGDEWTPKETTLQGITAGVPRKKGDQGDPWMAASPLIYDGMLYAIDIHSEYYVVDLKTGKRVGQKYMDFRGDSSYVSFRVAASPTLVGKYIVVMDSQGQSATLEPGPECKIIARNTLATQLQRDWANTTLDYTSYSAPVPDGKRMYLRGERWLYCIGQ